jgi:hypothetical protein
MSPNIVRRWMWRHAAMGDRDKVTQVRRMIDPLSAE